MGHLTLTRIVSFTASHHYAVRGWSAQRNREAFGKTARPHRHSYQCFVTVRGTPDPVTGMIIDLTALDRVLDEEVVRRFDGRDLNADTGFSGSGRLPTSESLAQLVWAAVAPRLPEGAALEVVRVQENPALYAEYRG